jgi:hypothetical protein
MWVEYCVSGIHGSFNGELPKLTRLTPSLYLQLHSDHHCVVFRRRGHRCCSAERFHKATKKLRGKFEANRISSFVHWTQLQTFRPQPRPAWPMRSMRWIVDEAWIHLLQTHLGFACGKWQRQNLVGQGRARAGKARIVELLAKPFSECMSVSCQDKAGHRQLNR